MQHHHIMFHIRTKGKLSLLKSLQGSILMVFLSHYRIVLLIALLIFLLYELTFLRYYHETVSKGCMTYENLHECTFRTNIVKEKLAGSALLVSKVSGTDAVMEIV